MQGSRRHPHTVADLHVIVVASGHQHRAAHRVLAVGAGEVIDVDDDLVADPRRLHGVHRSRQGHGARGDSREVGRRAGCKRATGDPGGSRGDDDEQRDRGPRTHNR